MNFNENNYYYDIDNIIVDIPKICVPKESLLYIISNNKNEV